jgi:hypothetical protein
MVICFAATKRNIGMNERLDACASFLGHLGVSAQISADSDEELVIQVPTAQYDSRRDQIDPWFTLVSQGENQSFFRERMRGTGSTL